jgi:hypothetical protein
LVVVEPSTIANFHAFHHGIPISMFFFSQVSKKCENNPRKSNKNRTTKQRHFDTLLENKRNKGYNVHGAPFIYMCS